MKIILISIVFLLSCFVSYSQDTDEQLALYYFNEGDCDKALPYLQKVYNKTPTDLIYSNYLSCLREKNESDKVLKLIKQQANAFPNMLQYQIAIGEEYERQNNEKKAIATFQSLIDNLQSIPKQITDLQAAFSNVGKYDWALKTLQKGDKLLSGNYPLNIQFAEVYGALNQTEKMIQAYIDLLDYSPGMISSLKVIIPRMIDFDSGDNERFIMFRNELIRKIQKNPGERVYSELLIWALIQHKNFSAALIQAKGLDKRTGNDGREVYSIGHQALQNKDFSTARNAFKYIVDLGENSPYYYASEQAVLSTYYKEITTQRNYSKEQIDETVSAYKNTINRMSKNGLIFPIVREMAYIQAYYGDQATEAVEILDSVLKFPRYNDLEAAKIKMLLADIKVLLNDVWDASLLYMQVEKKFKFEPIGEEAKFKNARIFYFDGDFKFAQAQLNILKESTTKLIANDAMNLSILITENLGLDSNYAAMQQFAKADLLLEQHKYEDAFKFYDSIIFIFPGHQLADDILMRKAKAYQDKGEWNNAIKSLKEIVEKHSDDILADDALFQIAQIYENHLFDNKKATDYYFQLMKDYPGSIFVTEARKAYRKIN